MNPGTRTTFRRVQTDLSEFIPEGWSAAPLKRYFRVVGGSTPKSDPENWDGDIPWVTPADLSGRESLSIRRGKRSVTERGLGSCGAELVPKGSIVISTRAPIGSLAIADTDLSTNQGCKALVPTRAVDSRFFAYGLSISTPQLNALGQGSTFSELSGTNLGRFCLPVPPLQEQRRIAAFLDYETARIDELVHEQQRLVELLTEQKSQRIFEAVTKGIHPDARLIESNSPWFGLIPEHWNLVKLKRLWRVIDCKHTTAEFVADGYPLASIREVQGFYVELSAAKQTTEADYLDLTQGGRKPRRGDIIFSRNATVGEAAIVATDEPFAMGQDVCLLRGQDNTSSSEFLLYQLRSHAVQAQLQQVMVGATFKRINVEDIKDCYIVVPPPTEQREIAGHLKAESAALDALIASAHHAVRLLRERRSALINAAVTGQLDLRNWRRPEHAEAAEVA